MHPKDLAHIWERWTKGATVFDLASEYGVSASKLHQALQIYLASTERWVGAA